MSLKYDFAGAGAAAAPRGAEHRGDALDRRDGWARHPCCQVLERDARQAGASASATFISQNVFID